jgi:hypothetical protein
MRRSRCGACHAIYTPFARLTPEASGTPLTETGLLASFCKFLSICSETVDVAAFLTYQLSPPDTPLSNLKERHLASTSKTSKPEKKVQRISAPVRRKEGHSPLTSKPPTLFPASSSPDPTWSLFLLARTVRSFVCDEVSSLVISSFPLLSSLLSGLSHTFSSSPPMSSSRPSIAICSARAI